LLFQGLFVAGNVDVAWKPLPLGIPRNVFPRVSQVLFCRTGSVCTRGWASGMTGWSVVPATVRLWLLWRRRRASR